MELPLRGHEEGPGRPVGEAEAEDSLGERARGGNAKGEVSRREEEEGISRDGGQQVHRPSKGKQRKQ